MFSDVRFLNNSTEFIEIYHQSYTGGQGLRINMNRKYIEHIRVPFRQRMIRLACGIITHHLEKV